jgi:hypothetical protein
MLLPGEKCYPPIEEVFERTRKKWYFIGGWPFVKGDWWRCRCCGSDEFLYRYWFPHNRQSGGNVTRYPWRCDVAFKCIECGATSVNGVVVPSDEHEQLEKSRQGNTDASRMTRLDAVARLKGTKWLRSE